MTVLITSPSSVFYDLEGIRTLQCILLKVAVLFGVQVFPGVTYRGLLEPDISEYIIKILIFLLASDLYYWLVADRASFVLNLPLFSELQNDNKIALLLKKHADKCMFGMHA